MIFSLVTQSTCLNCVSDDIKINYNIFHFSFGYFGRSKQYYILSISKNLRKSEKYKLFFLCHKQALWVTKDKFLRISLLMLLSTTEDSRTE